MVLPKIRFLPRYFFTCQESELPIKEREVISSRVHATLKVILSVRPSVDHAVEIFTEKLSKPHQCPCPPVRNNVVVYTASHHPKESLRGIQGITSRSEIRKKYEINTLSFFRPEELKNSFNLLANIVTR